MFYLVGPEDILRTVFTLAQQGSTTVTDHASLRGGYFEFQQQTQPGVTGERGARFGISSYSEGDEGFRPAFAYSASDPTWPAADGAWDVELLRQAHALLGEADENLLQVFELVTLWVYSPSSPARPGSGTLYLGNGLMYVNPEKEWTRGDVGEAYLHELTHILLSLDEYRFSHYSSYAQMDEEKFFAPTAILSVPKPLHLAFHSAVVATEVLAFRERLDELGEPSDLHHPTPELTETTAASLAAIRALVEAEPSLMTERGVELLGLTEQRLVDHAGSSV